MHKKLKPAFLVQLSGCLLKCVASFTIRFSFHTFVYASFYCPPSSDFVLGVHFGSYTDIDNVRSDDDVDRSSHSVSQLVGGGGEREREGGAMHKTFG